LPHVLRKPQRGPDQLTVIVDIHRWRYYSDGVEVHEQRCTVVDLQDWKDGLKELARLEAMASDWTNAVDQPDCEAALNVYFLEYSNEFPASFNATFRDIDERSLRKMQKTFFVAWCFADRSQPREQLKCGGYYLMASSHDVQI
jgi:hypothetical protein